ncbi:hypothetical protein Bhyg_06615 [Pseudolycoriella hygida]|uniref:Uncharacterized protein n=1 Tax=Pseudolycoriella hygida TaxID=35572 RepID=A0A9Q0N133_9DIPT|nr:hypothetical protein Bhyg_06615 [Pseudolycoriella hygida]
MGWWQWRATCKLRFQNLIWKHTSMR